MQPSELHGNQSSSDDPDSLQPPAAIAEPAAIVSNELPVNGPLAGAPQAIAPHCANLCVEETGKPQAFMHYRAGKVQYAVDYAFPFPLASWFNR